MMKLFFLFLMSKSVFAASACQLTSYAHIILADAKMAQTDQTAFISSSDCSPEILTAFRSLIVNSSGDLKNKQINFMLADTFPNDQIHITPETISVNDLNSFVKKALSLNENLEPVTASFINKKAFANCHSAYIKTNEVNLERTGNKNLVLQCDQQEIWTSANILRYRNALIAEETIPAFNTIQNRHLTNKKILASDDTNLFENAEILAFYKTGKTIAKGETLTANHLVPTKLTTYGKEAQLFVRSKSVVVKSRVISRGTGAINEVIEAYNPTNKKKINAKITGFNELTIEL
ncbi:MAG: flagella basal body P-ring formation protein FlgA [Bacteriovoracaceae bacterium]|nr:flagella basal body P-ring formation protein FlgA [Bacteriovoracaceae bacterium]